MRLIVGASKPKHWKLGAAAIMWWENTNASHCYTRIDVLPNVSVVFQAVGSGTEFCSTEYFLSRNKPVYEKEVLLSPEVFQKVLTKQVSSLKNKYSVLHLVGLFYKRLIQYSLNIIVKNPFKDQGKSAVCVESLCAIVDAADIKRIAEDPEDMGVYEALIMLRNIPGNELEIA